MRTRVAALVAALLLTGAALAGCSKPGTGTDPNNASGNGTLGQAGTPTTPASNGGTGGPTTVANPPTYPTDIIEYAKAAVLGLFQLRGRHSPFRLSMACSAKGLQR